MIPYRVLARRRVSATALLLAACAVVTSLAASAQSGNASTEARIIDKWRGTWVVQSTRRAPPPAQEISYEETFEWTLDGRFLKSETTRKSDGGRSMSMFWFDVFTKSYRFVIFDAGGFALELPPPVWHESTQTMQWKSGRLSPTSYTAHARFRDADTIEWKSVWQDWKGNSILELEGVSRRRK
jgi:hypothetical protein